MKRLIPIAVVLALSGTLPARADDAAAAKCAAPLSPPARLIYDTAVAHPIPGASLRDLLTARVRPLVVSGRIGMFEVRGAAEAASGCLRKLHPWSDD